MSLLMYVCTTITVCITRYLHLNSPVNGNIIHIISLHWQVIIQRIIHNVLHKSYQLVILLIINTLITSHVSQKNNYKTVARQGRAQSTRILSWLIVLCGYRNLHPPSPVWLPSHMLSTSLLSDIIIKCRGGTSIGHGCTNVHPIIFANEI